MVLCLAERNIIAIGLSRLGAGLSVSLSYKVNALRVRLSRVIDMLSYTDDSAFVTVTNTDTGLFQVGTLAWSDDGWVVIFYAQNHREVKVTDSFTVEVSN